MRALCLLLSTGTILGCGGRPPGGGELPATQSERYVVDAITLPRSASDFADDLTGDGHPSDQLGNVVALLAENNDDGAAAIPAMLSRCAFAPTVELPATASVGELRWTGGGADPTAAMA